MKKRMYYNMRIKTIQRNASNVLKLVKIAKKIKNLRLDFDITRINKKLYSVMREIDERHLLPPRNPDLPRIIMYGEAKSFDNPLDEFDQEQLMKDLDIK